MGTGAAKPTRIFLGRGAHGQNRMGIRQKYAGGHGGSGVAADRNVRAPSASDKSHPPPATSINAYRAASPGDAVLIDRIDGDVIRNAGIQTVDLATIGAADLVIIKEPVRGNAVSYDVEVGLGQG